MVNADFHAFSPLLSLRVYSSWWMDNNLQITFTNWKNITLRFLENCSSGLFKRFLENCKLRHSFGGSCEAQILRHCRIFLCNTYATFATFKHTCSDATASITSSKAHSMYVTVKYYFWIVQNLFPTTFGETYTSHKTVTFASAWNITLLLFWKHSKSKQRLDTYLISRSIQIFRTEYSLPNIIVSFFQSENTCTYDCTHFILFSQAVLLSWNESSQYLLCQAYYKLLINIWLILWALKS